MRVKMWMGMGMRIHDVEDGNMDGLYVSRRTQGKVMLGFEGVGRF